MIRPTAWSDEQRSSRYRTWRWFFARAANGSFPALMSAVVNGPDLPLGDWPDSALQLHQTSHSTLCAVFLLAAGRWCGTKRHFAAIAPVGAFAAYHCEYFRFKDSAKMLAIRQSLRKRGARTKASNVSPAKTMNERRMPVIWAMKPINGGPRSIPP